MTPIVGGTLLWTGALTAIGAVTMIVGAVRAVLERDLKRILAYSTISALGIMMLLFAGGTPAMATAGLMYLVAHACYKGALFLVAGAVDHETGVRDIEKLAGLRRAMPATAIGAGLAAASMAGVPLFAGFIAKEQFYEAVHLAPFQGAWRSLLTVGAVAASVCLGAAGLMAGVAPFRGRNVPTPVAHDAPVAMWIGPMLLGAVGLIVGSFPAAAFSPIAAAVAVITGGATAVPALWHGFTTTLALSGLTLVGAFFVFGVRRRVWQLGWPPALQAEHLYTAGMTALDAVSRRIGPLLQSASLRSYVLIVAATAIALVTTALARDGELPVLRRLTPVEIHEGLLAALIVAGALSAALARSTMTAVLSVGVVGYGVAVTYALLGAPDLAMTQFAVETLTVVIFVLVFSRLRGFGDLSSNFTKARDAVVAIGFGAIVTTLVLFIGASGTTSRLSTYFVETAPQSHGFKIVNVILVVFRGFDTMGEITVLATVAIGVRALLLIGRERRQ
jgi:multicomponent Na+:H+ antiporter subunit A